MQNRGPEVNIGQVVKSGLFGSNVSFKRARPIAESVLSRHPESDERIDWLGEALKQLGDSDDLKGFNSNRWDQVDAFLNTIFSYPPIPGKDPTSRFLTPASVDALYQLKIAQAKEAAAKIKAVAPEEISGRIDVITGGLNLRSSGGTEVWKALFATYPSGLSNRTNLHRSGTVELLKTMPIGTPNQADYPYLRSFNGVSMADIFDIPTPLSGAHFDRVNKYLSEFFAPGVSFEGSTVLPNPEAGFQAARLLFGLFLNPLPLHHDASQINIGSTAAPIVRLVHNWQRMFTKALVLEMAANGVDMTNLANRAMQHGSADRLELISLTATHHLFESAHVNSPLVKDQDRVYYEEVQRGVGEYLQTHHVDRDYAYFHDPLSLIKEVAAVIPYKLNRELIDDSEVLAPGLGEKTADILAKITGIEFARLKTSVAGNTTLEGAISNPQKQINASKRAWDRIKEKGIHFLPSSDVIDIVDHDEGTDESKFGLKTSSTQFLTENNGLSVRVRFDFHTGFSVTGVIGSDGVLHFSNEAIESGDSVVPQGFKAYLNKTASRLIHDIVVQRNAGMVKPRKRNDSDPGDRPEDSESAESGITSPDHRNPTVRRLPRTAWVRSAKELSEGTKVVTKFLRDNYPVLLPYSNAYLDSIVEYLALLDLVSRAEQSQLLTPLLTRIEDVVNEVKERRARVFRPSPDKLVTVPAGIQLLTAWDPTMDFENEEGFVIQTWVKSTGTEGQTVYRRNTQQPDSAFDWED